MAWGVVAGGPRRLPAGTVTFLFTDIEGSTGLLRTLGDGYERVLDRHRVLLRQAFERHGGAEVRCDGDGFFVAFPTTSGAVAACIEAQLALADEAWPEGIDVAVRMGAHVGDAEPVGDDYVSLAVHQAARIAAAANGGQVLLSQAAALLAGQPLPDDTRLVDLGEYRLKDFEGPQRLFELRHHRLRAEHAPLRTAAMRRGNLPRRLTSFVGRHEELETARKLLDTTCLLTITGAGGAGKTRLAVELAVAVSDSFDDGCWFVDLAPVSGDADVAATVVDVMGVREHLDESPIDTLLPHLADRRVLLVLDNCEHLVESCAAVADAVLSSCLDVTIVATSRTPLRVPAEVAWRLPPLRLPAVAATSVDELVDSEAGRLFVDRAAAAGSSTSWDEADVAAVVQTCRQLDGMPLAIELAASRTRVMSPRRIAERLDDRFALLTTGPRTALPRQQTLRALVDWSHDLLSEPARALLRRLAVFAGPFEVAAVEAVCAGPDIDDVLEPLAELVDQSLVVFDPGESTYQLLETIREYAAERLRAASDELIAEQRHLDYYLELAERAFGELTGRDQAAWGDRLEQERPNLAAALRTALVGRPADALRMAVALGRFWLDRGHFTEGRDWLERALAATPDADARLRARGWSALSRMAMSQGDFDVATAAADEATTAAQDAGPGARAAAAWNHGELALRQGRLDDAGRHFEVSLAQARMAGDVQAQVHAMAGLGERAQRLGRLEEARAMFAGALAASEPTVHRMLIASIHGSLGELALREGDTGTARAEFEQELDIARRFRHLYLTALAMGDLSNVATLEGRLDDALALAEDALVLSESMGDRQGIARALIALGQICHLGGDPGGAHPLLERARDEAAAIGLQSSLIEALSQLARTRFALGDRDGARAAMVEAAENIRRVGDPAMAFFPLYGLGELAAGDGDHERAARLLAAAYQFDRGPTPVPDDADDDVVAVVRTALGDARLGDLWRQGQSMALDDALVLGIGRGGIR